MANTITNMIPIIYDALDIVSRELVGFIPAVGRDSSADSVAVGQTINIYIAPPATTADITPGTNAPDDGDQTFGNTTMTITKSKYSPVRWSGEEELSVAKNPAAKKAITDQFAQSMRALCNLVEIDLSDAAKAGASRAFGTAGTTPFGTAADLTDLANLFKILDDNGAPKTDRQLVLGTAAMVNLRGKHSELFKVNESGSDELLRDGIVGRLMGSAVRDSAGVRAHTKGTGTLYQLNGAHAVGATSIAVDTGSGTIVAGDIITIAGGTPADTNKYVVLTGVAAPGTITIGSPGLLSSHLDNDAVTIGNNYTNNSYFVRPYLQLATRNPAMPSGGDMADDVTSVTDPISGLSFQVAVYRQYRRVKWEIGLAWGVKAVKGDGIATLLG